MKDNEIIAILEACDDEQRARVMAWARKRWPSPKKAAKAAPATPAKPTLDGDAWKRFVEEMQRAKPVPLPDPMRDPWPPRPVVPERRQAIPDYWLDPNPRYPIVCGDATVTTLSSHRLTVDIGAGSLLVNTTPEWTVRNGDPS